MCVLDLCSERWQSTLFQIFWSVELSDIKDLSLCFATTAKREAAGNVAANFILSLQNAPPFLVLLLQGKVVTAKRRTISSFAATK